MRGDILFSKIGRGIVIFKTSKEVIEIYPNKNGDVEEKKMVIASTFILKILHVTINKTHCPPTQGRPKP